MKKKARAKAKAGRRAETPAARQGVKAGRAAPRAARGEPPRRGVRAPKRKAGAPARSKRRAAPRRRPTAEAERGEIVGLEARLQHSESGPPITGGDVDADWQRAASSGEEAVGGSVATPDQDVVDELGRALGVEQPSDAPMRSSEEILRDRDRHYWQLERRRAEEEDAARDAGGETPEAP